MDGLVKRRIRSSIQCIARSTCIFSCEIHKITTIEHCLQWEVVAMNRSAVFNRWLTVQVMLHLYHIVKNIAQLVLNRCRRRFGVRQMGFGSRSCRRHVEQDVHKMTYLVHLSFPLPNTKLVLSHRHLGSRYYVSTSFTFFCDLRVCCF